ncbi:MAG: alpha/beta hydrolase [Methylomonas sp.]|jgi:pimeloyl-ACP methyl ester carboxylesterase|uniref:alpha/beta fold hydrolase n=1 Tax=Methylomonas sp. TaxID=418 RepID=UPI002600F374|nr:alpha/beta hydrolase [Methylomonas sp.]MCK9605806.1 alpha/beta hydrolase [Methylomonas sp.]
MHSEQFLAYRQFGAADGQPVIYFHGTPGSADECEIFDLHGKQHQLTIICYDRSTIAPKLQGNAYYQCLADEITNKVGAKPVDFIGFSIGAFIALQVCRAMNGKVRSLHLVSAAAPLDAGNFIDAAAGKAVFRLAQNHPSAFLRLARVQGEIARRLPGLLLRMLFSSAVGEDKALAEDKTFRAAMTQTLKTCFKRDSLGYARDVIAYVQPWKAMLADVSTDTYIWHGAEDNWSPVAMADFLATALPGCSKVTVLDGLSHYSCLYRAAPTICLAIKTFS